jgi:uncharacterized C2H2 Zn-finger protein
MTMNITTVNELVEVNIMLDRDEAIAALDDPSELQKQLREALGDVPANGRKAPKGRRAVKGLTRGRARKTTRCPHCDQPFAKRGNLERHILRVHGMTDATPAADSLTQATEQ